MFSVGLWLPAAKVPGLPRGCCGSAGVCLGRVAALSKYHKVNYGCFLDLIQQEEEPDRESCPLTCSGLLAGSSLKHSCLFFGETCFIWYPQKICGGVEVGFEDNGKNGFRECFKYAWV